MTKIQSTSTEALEDVLSDLLGGVVVDPNRQGKRNDPGFFGIRRIDGKEVGKIVNIERHEK